MIDNTIIILGEKIRLYPMDRSSLPILYADEQLFFADIKKIPVCIFKVNNLKWTLKQFSIAAKMSFVLSSKMIMPMRRERIGIL